MELYLWHGIPCFLLTHSPFRKGIKRNALIEFCTGLRMVVPWRALRRPKWN